MAQASFQRFTIISHQAVQIDDQFWKPKIEANRKISLLYQYEQLKTSGVLDNFLWVAEGIRGQHRGPYWMDSDAYKWLEAASYSLVTFPDPKLQACVDEVISIIAAAQEKDGYLNTYFQLMELDKRWTNLGMCHELYCAGHLIQAAVANVHLHAEHSLLDIACRFVDHIDNTFGPGKETALPGHEEIETALVDLYRYTDEKRYLKLAIYFINQRGQKDSRLRQELKHLDGIGGGPLKLNTQFYGTYENYDGRYSQDHLPVREQTEVVGHAVRAMYLYCGMADVVTETGDSGLMDALENLWVNVTRRRMYITGGIGPAKSNEGFTHDYDLPNETAYAETCAAVGMIMWNHRLLQLKGEGRFADIMERVLYNGFLAGISMDSQKFFYVNPLRSAGEHHRQGWFECACCPPNMARLFASMGNYIYSKCDDGLAVHLYIQSKVQIELASGNTLQLRQKTKYPWEGIISFQIQVSDPEDFTLYLRIPEWCRQYTIKVNQNTQKAKAESGYIRIRRNWQTGDQVKLELDMPVERIEANPAVWEDVGRVALQRGPVVYCLENTDHSVDVQKIHLSRNSQLKVSFISDLLGGVSVIEGEATVLNGGNWQDTLYRRQGNNTYETVQLKAIPYYAWDNRYPGAMTVWIHEQK